MIALKMKKGFITCNQVSFVELHSNRHQCSCSLPFQPPLLPLLLFRNWPALPWLYLPMLLSSFFLLHHPAVARLTCKASSQKSVRSLDGLCRPQRVQLHYPQTFLVLTHIMNKRLRHHSWSVPIGPDKSYISHS